MRRSHGIKTQKRIVEKVEKVLKLFLKIKISNMLKYYIGVIIYKYSYDSLEITSQLTLLVDKRRKNRLSSEILPEL